MYGNDLTLTAGRLLVEEENDLEAIGQAIEEAKADLNQSDLIEVKTTIGFGSPNKGGKGGQAGPHGAPLGADEVKLTKAAYGWPEEPDFYVPEEVRAHFGRSERARRLKRRKLGMRSFAAYKETYPELAAQFEMAVSGQLPEGWDADLPTYTPEDKAVSTRVASGTALNGFAKNVPNLLVGPPTWKLRPMTHLNGLPVFKRGSYDGRNVYFGVREFGMAAA